VVDFGALKAPVVMRVLTASLVFIAVGVQLSFTVFLLSIIDLPLHRKASNER
jgi:hypothetical protein